MKSLYTLFILSSIALAGVFPVNVHATELKFEGMVTLTPSCTPWDGPAYQLNFDLPDTAEFPKAHFQGSVWGQGIESLYRGFQQGKGFSINDPEGGVESMGNAYVSGENKPSVFVKAKFIPIVQPSVLLEPVGIGPWMIEIPMPSPSTKTYIYKINSSISQAKPRCG